MSALPAVIQFEDVALDVVDRNNQPWLRVSQIGRALGYAQPDAHMTRLYQQHADEFTDAMTAVVKLDTAGGKQDVRIFSPRGCWLLGMFARTERAKAFRAWVLDVLEGLAPAPGAAEPRAAYPRRGEADAVVDANRMFQAYLRTAGSLKLPLSRVASITNECVALRTGIDIMADLGVQPEELVKPMPETASPRSVKLDDPWFPTVRDWVGDRAETHATQVLEGTGLAKPDDRSAQSRVGLILLKMGFTGRRQSRDSTGRMQWWRLRPKPQ